MSMNICIFIPIFSFLLLFFLYFNLDSSINTYESSKSLHKFSFATEKEETATTFTSSELNTTRQKMINDRDAFWSNYDPWVKSEEFMTSQSQLIPKTRSQKVIDDLNINDNTASSFKIYSDEHYSRMYYVHMKNVCYNFKNNTILFYKSTDPELSKLTTGNTLFKWTLLKFQNLNQPFPVDTYYTFEEEGIWLQSIRFIHHVAHFFESLAVPFNAILKPAFFQGPIRKVFLTNLSKLNSYNQQTLEAFKDIYQKVNIVLYQKQDVYDQLLSGYSNSIICFKTVGALERQQKLALGGYFYLDLGTDIYRSYIYKQYDLHYERMNKQRYSTLLIDRKGPRKWTYLKDMVNLIQTNYSSILDLKVKYLESLKPREQIQSMFESDIVLLSHGGGEVNILFIKPYSVVLEGNPDYFYQSFGSTIAGISRVYFIQLNNQYEPLKIKECGMFSPHAKFVCSQRVIQTDLHVPIDYVRSGLNEAIRYLNSIDFDLYRPVSPYIL